MTAFDNREKAEENKYAHDKELEFRVYARYHSLLAAWVGDVTKRDEAGKDAYRNALVTGVMNSHDQTALFNKIRHDLLAHDAHIKDHDIQQKMHDIMQVARKQVAGE